MRNPSQVEMTLIRGEFSADKRNASFESLLGVGWNSSLRGGAGSLGPVDCSLITM